MRLYVVRHGQTWANMEYRYLGSMDPPLTDLGRAQAAQLSENLPPGVDTLVCSPLLRARETACILGHQLGLAPLILDAFRERDVGVFEGLTQAEAKVRHPELWAQNITRRWALGPPGGESIAAVVERVRGGLQALASSASERTVVLVAHGFVAKTIRGLVSNDFADFYDWQLGNGEVLFLPEVTAGLLRPVAASYPPEE